MINESRIVPFDTCGLPVDDGPWMVFAPHADDESFGMGGTIAKAVKAGIVVYPVIITNGALGGSHENLIETRKQEAVRAAEVLGMERPQFLEINDREVSNNPQVVDYVLEQLQAVMPAAAFFPGVFELHPDHRATTLAVWKALSLLGSKMDNQKVVPVSYEVLVQSPVNCLVDITGYKEAKDRAMAVYQSQLTESPYVAISSALNTLRTLTLPDHVSFAEGFFRFSPELVQNELWEFISHEISAYFER